MATRKQRTDTTATEPAAPISRFPLLRIAQVCERLGGTPQGTVEDWVYKGRLRAFKPGRYLLFREEDLAAFVQQSVVVDLDRMRRER